MSETQFLIGRNGLDLQDDFYPDDLPSEWRFDYYSTLFKALSLPLDTDEDLEQIFEEIQDSKEESEESEEGFELILSIQNSQLINTKKLKKLLDSVADYTQHFTLFCEVEKPPTKEIMQILKGYQICFQSSKALKIGLQEVVVAGQYLSFNRQPVLYASQVLDEKQIRNYLETVANVKTKTILICQFAESETLNKVRIIAELLGY
ncbi:MAG: hypothetical protein HAW58_01415 [Candidatus Thioglobus sp.]|nr:hypothetical protein [Candidatus Thioglobus sp.]